MINEESFIWCEVTRSCSTNLRSDHLTDCDCVLNLNEMRRATATATCLLSSHPPLLEAGRNVDSPKSLLSGAQISQHTGDVSTSRSSPPPPLQSGNKVSWPGRPHFASISFQFQSKSRPELRFG